MDLCRCDQISYYAFFVTRVQSKTLIYVSMVKKDTGTVLDNQKLKLVTLGLTPNW